MVTVGVLDFQFTADTAAYDAGVARVEASLGRLEKSAGSLKLDLGGAQASKSIGDLETTMTRFQTTVKANGDTVSKYTEEMNANVQASVLLKQAQADAAEMLALYRKNMADGAEQMVAYRKNMADVAETQVLLKETQIEAVEATIKLRAAQADAADSLSQERVAAAGAADALAILRTAQTGTADAATALKIAQTGTADATTAMRVAQEGAADALAQERVAAASASDALVILRTAQTATADAATALKVAQTGTADAATAMRVAQEGAADALAQERIAAASAADALVLLRQAQTLSTDALTASRVAATANATALNDARIATEQLRAEKVASAIAIQEEAAAFRTASATATDHKKSLEDMAGATKKAAEALGLMVIAETALDALSVKSAADWQSKTNEIQNNTVMTTADVQVMDTAIRNMASRSPASMNDLADGFAHIFNFGNSATDSVKLLNVAMQSAVATGTKVADTANVLASVMHEFKINTDDASTTMNVLHVAAAEGNQTLQSFVENSAAALSIAANLGVSLNQTAAGFIALSRSGLDASRVNTQMIGIMTHIIDPTAAATKEIQRLSKATGIDLVGDFTLVGLQSRGFSGVMQDVEKAIAGGGDEILKLIPALRGGTGALALTGSAAGDLDTALSDINDTVAGKTNPTLDAFQRTQDTLAFKIGVFKNTVRLLAIELGTVLMPVVQALIDGMVRLGDAIGQHFNIPGLSEARQSTDDLNTSIAAADDSAKKLGGSLQLPGQNGAAEARQKIQDMKDQATDLDAKILDANNHLADWGKSLKDTQEQMRDINDNYKAQLDPLQAQIRHNNLLSPEEIARQVAEAQNDLDKAKLELTKPDVSQYTKAAADAQQAKDNLIKPDFTALDATISNYQDAISKVGQGDTDGIDAQIQKIQDTINNLNTNDLADKINKIKDLLSQPAPDTHGITNQLTELNAQLAGGQISQSAFDAQYGALSLQKQGINTKYIDDTAGLAGQLKLLERQKADADQMNKETALADRNQIESLKQKRDEIVKNDTIEKKGLQQHLDDLKDIRKWADADYTKQVSDLDKTIKQNQDKAKAMLAPYTDKVNVLDAQQAYNKLLDAAATAARNIANAPIKAKIDELQSAQADLIDPLQKQADGYQKLIDKSQEDVKQWQLKKDAIEATLKAIMIIPSLAPGTVGYGKGILTPGLGVSPYDEPKGTGKDVTDPFIGPMPASGVVQGVTQFIDKMIEYGTWVAQHGTETLTFMAGLGVAFVALAIVLNPAAALVLGLSAVVGFFLYDYNTNPTFKRYIDDIAGAFDNMADGVLRAVNAVRSWMGLDPIGGSGKLGPVGDNGSANYNPAYPPPATAGTRPYQDGSGQWHYGTPGTAPGYTPGFKEPSGGGGGNFIDNVLGTSKVGASDFEGQQEAIDAYVQHIQDYLGDNGIATAAIQTFKNTIVDDMGRGSSAADALQDAQRNFEQSFGDGSPVQTALKQMVANGIDPTNNLLQRYMASGGNWQSFLQSFSGSATTNLGTSGPTGQAFKDFSSGVGTTDLALGKVFGAGGSMDGHLANVASKFGGTVGDGGSAQTDMTSLDSHAAGIFGGNGSVETTFTGLIGFFNGEWATIGKAISKPFTDGQADIGSFFTYLSGGINWLAEHFQMPPIAAYTGAAASASTANNAAIHQVGHADGLGGGMAGHWAMIGERGPEAMYVPANAVIVPNHLLPGHADGLNMDGLLDGMGGVLAHHAGALVDGMMGQLGTAAIPGLQGAGAALGDQIAGGLKNWLSTSTVENPPAAASRSGGSALDIVNAVKAATSDPDIWLSMLMAVASEQRTLTGPFIDQLGGGPGRGPFQIEAGPGGSHDLRLYAPPTGFPEDDARDPFKAAAYMVGEFTSHKRGPWATDEEVAAAMTAAAAERGRAFLDGNVLGYDRSVVDASYRMAKDALAASLVGPQRTPGSPAGGDQDALNDALGYVGETTVPRGQYAGQPWDYFCEVFNEMVAEDLGLGYAGALTARDHGQRLLDTGVLIKGGIPPAGYSTYWDQTFFPGFGGAGHVAISEGDGTFVSSHVGGISDHYGSGWLDHPGLMGYAPPGAEDGGLFTKPTNILIGEGREKEWALPDSKLRETVREESGGVSLTFAANSIVVNAADGMSEAKVAGMVADEVYDVFVQGLHERGR